MADINIGSISEALNNKIDLPIGKAQDSIDYVIEHGETNGINWEKWKSGKLIQRGTATVNGTQVLPVPYADTNFNIYRSPQINYNGNITGYSFWVITKTTTSFDCFINEAQIAVDWLAIGKGA